ncbi:MAG: sialidase family protein [Stackebrandtia sp.]
MSKSRRVAWAAVAGGVIMALAVGSGTSFGESPDADETETSALSPEYGEVTVEPEDPNRQYRAMPSLQYVSWDDGGTARHRLVRSFIISADGVPPVKMRIQYQDDSGVWKEAEDARTGAPLMESEDAQNAAVTNVYTAADGNLEAVEVRGRIDDSGRYFLKWISKDGGVSWAPARVDLDFNGGAILDGSAGLAFQDVLTLPDDTLVMPFYSAHKQVGDQTLYASHLLAGGTDGAAWQRAATVFQIETVTYNEATVTRREDGRLIMIARYEEDKNGYHYSKLRARVTNEAVNSAADLANATWGEIYPVVVPGSADPDVVLGVAPILHTMEDGVLMLVYGRPRNKITFSYDGGATWITVHSYYDNIPTDCRTGYGGNPCGALGSSGYMGVAVTSPTTAYIMGDNCQSGWGCAADYSYPHGVTDLLWQSSVELK